VADTVVMCLSPLRPRFDSCSIELYDHYNFTSVACENSVSSLTVSKNKRTYCYRHTNAVRAVAIDQRGLPERKYCSHLNEALGVKHGLTNLEASKRLHT
jgi:hypothetical protein